MKDQHKKDMGKMGEALVIHQLLENGFSVFVEFGDNSKVDLICLDSYKQLHKIQVKTVSRDNKDCNVNTLYLYKNGPNYRFKYEESDTDWFALVDVMTKQIAWISSTILQTHTSGIKLRHTLPKGRNQHGYKMFVDYTTIPFK